MTDIGFRVTRSPGPLFNADAIVHQALDIVNKHLTGAIDKGKIYPPPPPAPANAKSHRYKRTYTLRDSWHLIPAHFDGSVIRGSAYNNATDKWGRHYPSYVFGSTEYDQAPIHRGRWPKRTELIDKRAMDAELRALFRR